MKDVPAKNCVARAAVARGAVKAAGTNEIDCPV